MAKLAIMIGHADDDLIAFFQNIGKSGASYLTVSPGSGRDPWRKATEKIVKLKAGDELYLIAHGDGSSWGSKGDAVSVTEEVVVEYLGQTVPDGVYVYMCICDSIGAGKALKQSNPSLRIWASDGTPTLQWKDGAVVDTSKNHAFQEVILNARRKSLSD